MSGTISRAQALQDTTSRLVLVNASKGPQPLFETNFVETLGIRKFLVYAEEDLRHQVELAARQPGMTRAQLNSIKAGAEVIAAWIAGNMMTVDAMLQQPKSEDVQPKTGDCGND